MNKNDQEIRQSNRNPNKYGAHDIGEGVTNTNTVPSVQTNQVIELDSDDYITNDRELIRFCQRVVKQMRLEWDRHEPVGGRNLLEYCVENLLTTLADSEHVIYIYRASIICTFCNTSDAEITLEFAESAFRKALSLDPEEDTLDILTQLTALSALYHQARRIINTFQ